MRSDGRKEANTTRPTELEWGWRSNAAQPHAVSAGMEATHDRLHRAHSGQDRLCCAAENIPARSSPVTTLDDTRIGLDRLAPGVKRKNPWGHGASAAPSQESPSSSGAAAGPASAAGDVDDV